MADNIFKIPKLEVSSNYDIWSIRIESLLIQQGYLDVMSIDITTLSIEEHNLLQEKASKATSYIRLALGDGPLIATRYITNPFLLWNKLKDLYEAKGFSSEFLLCRELIATTLSSSKNNLELYIQNFKRVLNSLQAKNIILPNKFIVAFRLSNLNKDYDYIVTIITQTIRSKQEEDLDVD